MTHLYIKIGRLGGGGSDYSAFVQHIGIPSVDMAIGSGLFYAFFICLCSLSYIPEMFCCLHLTDCEFF